jgi:ligand-binding sensor domain-containing protein/signal transduction histidine kinase
MEDGLPENTVSAVVQTRDSYLWLGSYGGLARFDGVRFTVFNNDNAPEMRDNAVTSLFEAQDGALWIGHENGELTRFKDGQFAAVSIPTTAELGKLLAIASDEAGEVWVMSYDGLLARVRDGLVLRPQPGPSTSLVALTRSPNGTMWLMRNGVIFELSRGKLKVAEPAIQPTNGLVQGLCASRDGGLWIASQERLRKWKNGHWVRDLGAAPWGSAAVLELIETKAGCLAAATAELGFFLVGLGEPGQAAHFSRTNGFPSDWIPCLCEDHEGGLWAGTGGAGLTLLRKKRVGTLCPPDQWQGRTVLSVSPGQDGSLWIGTEGAGLYHYRDGTWENFGFPQGLHPYVWSAVEDSQGVLWIGTWGAGLYTRRNGQIQAVPVTDAAQPGMSAVLCSRQGGLWVGTEAGLLRWKDGRATWYRQCAGQPLRRIRAVVEDQDGGVWFGSLGSGLGCLKGGQIRQFRKPDGLASDFIECLYLDREGVLWIGTQGAGLCRLKQGHFAALAERQGLLSAHVSDIEQDGEGFFWMGSRDGIMRVAKAELDRCLDGQTNEVSCVIYGPGDGMPTAACSGRLQPAGCKTPDGRLWFPTPKGLVVVSPQAVKALPGAPPVVIERLLVDDRVVGGGVSLARQTRIAPGSHRLEFQYTGLSFAAPERVHFKYRLEGLETQWVDAGAKRTANYSHIPPGAYTFRVRACSSDGVWAQTGAAAPFYVAPYFWQTWWFGLLAATALAGLGGGIAWFDSRLRMRARLRRSERERAIEHERARIARDIHDDVGAQLTRITMLSESARGQLDRPDQAIAGLSQIYDTARELTRAMDEIVWAVNPKHDSLEGLASYLEKFAVDLLGTARIECRLDFPLKFPKWPLTSEIRHNVFLAFKEALNNVVRHAAAAQASIVLRVQERFFEIIVEDNGRGFAPAAVTHRGGPEPEAFSGGNGLGNLRERLAQAGGTCEIRSAPGQGTRVVFRVEVNGSKN